MARAAERLGSSDTMATGSGTILGGVVAMATALGCSSILGIDEDYSLGAGGTGGGTGGTTTSSTTSSQGGGGGSGGAATTLLMDYDDGVPDNDVHDGDLSGGGFDDTSASTDSSPFAEHSVWFHHDGTQDTECAKTLVDDNGAKTDGSTRSGVLTGTKVFHASTGGTGYAFATGDSHVIRFVWRDALQWDDATGTVTTAIGYYEDEGGSGFDPTTAPFTIVSSLTTDPSTQDSTWEEGGGTFPDTAPSAAADKTLYVRITANTAFARIDNITLTAHSSAGP